MIKQTLISWLPLAVGGTVVFITLYAVVQQNYRQNANDPQIELAESAAQALSSGFPIDALFQGANRIDMSKSLAPFGMVFDDKGTPLASSGFNGSSSPELPPSGIFDYVRAHGEDRVTWQTPTGQRFAAVVHGWKNTTIRTATGTPASGFVLAARSLRLVEEREDQLSWITFFGWLGFIVLTFVLQLGTAAYKRS